MLSKQENKEEHSPAIESIQHNKNKNDKIQYILDCKEKQICMQSCDSGSWWGGSMNVGYVRSKHYKAPCLKECSQIICKNPDS